MKERRPCKREFTASHFRSYSLESMVDLDPDQMIWGPNRWRRSRRARAWPRGGSSVQSVSSTLLFQCLFSKWKPRGFSFLKVKLKFLVLDNYNNLVTNHRNFKCFKDFYWSSQRSPFFITSTALCSTPFISSSIRLRSMEIHPRWSELDAQRVAAKKYENLSERNI